MQGIRLFVAVLAAFVICGTGITLAAQNDVADAGPPAENLPNALDIEKTDSEAAEKLPHVDLGRDEALELMSAVFSRKLQDPAGILGELEVEKFYGENVAVIEAGDQPGVTGNVGGNEPTLLESSVPLATEDADGNWNAVDLSLERVDGELQPANPLVDVGIPARLGEGLSLPDVGIEISLVDAPIDRAPSIAEQNTAFYPNVALDTDLTVVPTTDGVETLTQLRSAEAPRRQTFDLSLPDDAHLHEAEAGGAEVVQGGKAIIVIPPPTAMDAEGSAVPVTLETVGDSLVIAASPDADAVYPVLVDPLYEQPYVWMWNHTFAGMGDWHKELNAKASGVPYEFPFSQEGYINGVGFFPGLTIKTGVGIVPANSQAKWQYYVPRYISDFQAVGERPTSFIRTMSLHRLWYSVDEGIPRPITGSPVFRFGLWNVGNENWTAEGHRFGTEGNLHDLDYMYYALNPQEQVGAKIGTMMLDAYESQLQYRQLYAGEAAIELSDKDAPGISKVTTPSGWVNDKVVTPLTVTASDPGLGIKEILVKQPNFMQVATKSTCTGIASNPCSRTWDSSKGGVPPVSYEPKLMPQGHNFVEIEAIDPIGHRSPEEGHGPSFVKVKVDHQAPLLSLSGSATEQATLGTTASQYTLKASATDGDNAAPTAIAPFGAAGIGPGQMQEPRGVAADANGNLWVVDRGNGRVMKYDSNGNFLMQFGSFGSGNGQFSDPRSIAVGSNGTIWVSDMGNNSVQAFNASGQFIRKITYQSFVDPCGVAVGPGGVVWVSDISADQLFEFSESGAFIRTASGSASNPTGPTELKSATGLATDPSGNVWLVDYLSNRVQKFDSSGKYLMQFGSTGAGTGQLENPIAIAVTSSGNVLVTEEKNNRVDVFQASGAYLRQFGSAGSENGGLSAPKGIATGANNTAFIVDSGNHRVARWSHADLDRQAGVASTEVKLDGQPVEPKYAPGCATENCSITKEWTLLAKDYESGQHNVQVTVTDGVGLPTTKSLTITTVKDTTGPKVTAVNEFFKMPKNWFEQKNYSYSATMSDPGGYGVTSFEFKIDGKVVKSTTQSCPNGGCGATISGSINMATYKGGAHPAEFVATDVAGNTTKITATYNVDPKGTIPVSEAIDTLEAVEDTSLVNPIGEPQEEAEYDGTAPGLGVEESAGEIQATGTQVPVAIGETPADGVVMEVLNDGTFAAPCSAEEELGEVEEGELEPLEPCKTQAELEAEAKAAEGGGGEVGLTTIELTPVQVGSGASENKVTAGVATVAANTMGHVDTIVRPLYDGAMTFQALRDAMAPEAFSWKVQLEPDQELKSIDARHAVVYYDEKHPAFGITAVAAHDATGASVPTKLAVSGNDIIILSVEHHQVAQEGHPFIYPIIGGAGWEGGFQTYQVVMPPPEPEEEEEEATVEKSGSHIVVHISAIGPPTASASTGGNTPPRGFIFSECRFAFVGKSPVIQIPKMALAGSCRLQEEHENAPLIAGMTVRGWFHYIPGEWVWVNEKPANQLECIKWGSAQPARVHCETAPPKSHSAITVRGAYRFAPGTWIPNLATCVVVYGHLSSSAPHRDVQESWIDMIDPSNPCNWPF